MDKILEKINKKFSLTNKFDLFPDYITNIHFPCFKGLEPNSEIFFRFPLTVLVGENGCGKSSVLQALETTPEGVSYTAKWFSTNVDPIPENPRPAFWYTYYNSEAKREVQVLNQRTKKKDNPDYWEPSRPVVKYGMEKFEEHTPPLPGASQTRWNGTKRDVLYVDFRAEITAFDRYFYYDENPNTKKWKTKQDFLRYKSKYLKSVLNGEITTSFTFRDKKPVLSIELLSKEEVDIISEILDKKYTNIKIINHCFYKHNGDSVFFSQKDSVK